ncbi:MAG: tetratricopeptide repeat protein [Candidatus Cloacimonetes bacterium]|nr:tetratricopeptide repeat protein [Candidatus Cloacimonadota bacterium]
MFIRRLIPVMITLVVLMAGCATTKKVEEPPPVPRVRPAELAQNLKIAGADAHEAKDYVAAMRSYSEALALYEQLLPTAPETDSVSVDIERLTLNIAKLYIDIGFDDYARAQYDQALENFVQALETYSKIVPVTISEADYIGLILDLYKNIAIVAQSAGEYFMALEYYNKILELEPANEEVLNYKFVLLKDNLKDEKAAFEALKQFADVSQSPNAYLQLAIKYREQGNNAEAAKYYDQALALSNDPTLINTVADFYRATQQWLKSSQLYERFIATNPDRASLTTAYKLIGDNYRQARNNAKMVEFFEKYLELESDPQIALLVASHYNGTKTYGKVVTYASMTLSAEPGNSDARMLRGIAYYNLKRNNEAKADFDRLQNDPKYGDQAKQFLKAIK